MKNNRLTIAAQAVKSNRQLMAGCIGVLALLVLMIAAPLISTEDPTIYGPDVLNGLGENGHILGTNHLGQDVYSMIIYGVRTSVKVAVISAMISPPL